MSEQVHVVAAVLVIESVTGDEQLHKVVDTVWRDEAFAEARASAIEDDGLAGYEVASAHVRQRPLSSTESDSRDEQLED